MSRHDGHSMSLPCCARPPAGDQPENWRAPSRVLAGRLTLNLERLFCPSVAFEGGLSEVACAGGGTPLTGWYMFQLGSPAGTGSRSLMLWSASERTPFESFVFVLGSCSPSLVGSVPGGLFYPAVLALLPVRSTLSPAYSCTVYARQ